MMDEIHVELMVSYVGLERVSKSHGRLCATSDVRGDTGDSISHYRCTTRHSTALHIIDR